MPKLKPGDKVPNFTLKDLQGRAFTLYEHLNNLKTLLIFYRGEWCLICNIYLANLQQRATEFKENDTQIIAISTDTSSDAATLQKRAGLSFKVLPELSQDIIEAYDLFYNEKFRHSEPAIFILLPDGTIAYEAIISGTLGRPSVDDILSIIRHT